VERVGLLCARFRWCGGAFEVAEDSTERVGLAFARLRWEDEKFDSLVAFEARLDPSACSEPWVGFERKEEREDWPSLEAGFSTALSIPPAWVCRWLFVEILPFSIRPFMALRP